jgi:thymidylate synthase (FAD)
MSVKVVAITKPLIDGVETAEEFIAYAARVSNPSNQMNKETSGKLLRYCIKNKHWSVFEQVFLTLEITTTRDIGRQILRHRSFTFQEFSARYADPTKELGFVTREARLQDLKNRQNSIQTDDDLLQECWLQSQKAVTDVAVMNYDWAINNGIAKEVARAVLPEGLIETRMYMSGSLRSFIHWIDVRAEEGTQKEHREVALAARDEILGHFPSLNEYWFPKVEIRDYTGTKKRCEHCFAPIETKPWWKFWS